MFLSFFSGLIDCFPLIIPFIFSMGHGNLLLFLTYSLIFLTCTSFLGSLSVGDTVLTRYPYNFNGVHNSVTYTPDSSCQKQQTSFSYISSDPTAKDPLQVVIKVGLKFEIFILQLFY